MGKCIRAELEREMDPQTKLHRFRYHLGRGFVVPGDTVLDIGSGTGYGSALLAEVAKQVISFELDPAEVAGAKQHHQAGNIEFRCENLEKIDLPAADVACAFEVIEHLYDPKAFVARLKQAIKRYIIVSVPIGETLIDVNGDPQAKGDWSHHSVFSTPHDLNSLFVDECWEVFYSFQEGVTLISCFYNREAI